VRLLRAAAAAAKEALADHLRGQAGLEAQRRVDDYRSAHASAAATASVAQAAALRARQAVAKLKRSRHRPVDEEDAASAATATAADASATALRAEAAVAVAAAQLSRAEAAAVATQELADAEAAAAAEQRATRKRLSRKAHTTVWAHVSEARGLLPSDKSGAFADPFAVLELVYRDSGLAVKPPNGFKNAAGSFALKAHTRTAARTLNPKWTDASAKVKDAVAAPESATSSPVFCTACYFFLRCAMFALPSI
jgi:hypothetical protein